MVALYLLTIGITGLQLLGAQTWVTNVFYGAALIIAVTAARLAATTTDSTGCPEAAAGMSSLALSVRGLSKSYGASKALVDVDFDVRAGEVHGLLGQNGSGKSTLVKVVTGVTTPDSGSMQLFGRTLGTPVRNLAKHGIAVIHQDLGLAPAMTVLENLGVNAGYGTRPLGW